MEPVSASPDFSKLEEELCEQWREEHVFERQNELTEGQPEFKFYDGPPFCTGLPHYGHLLAGTVKDVVCRYKISTGHHVNRMAGWDTHGLPVEYEIDKKLGVRGPSDVTGPGGIGIKQYNAECRRIVLKYAEEWRSIVNRTGRWVDFDHAYLTLQPTFMESVWWVFKQLADRGYLYRGVKVMPYSTGCCTPLSNFEAQQNYKDVSDPAVYVLFPIVGDADDAQLMAWTTTPWTLPSNLALAVNPEMTYVRVRETATGRVFVVGKARLGAIWPTKKGQPVPYEVLAEMRGSDLVGLHYRPLFNYFVDYLGQETSPLVHTVIGASYVQDDSGTCVVHEAPYFGEDDYAACVAAGVIRADATRIVCPLDDRGCFTNKVPDFCGTYVKDADVPIIEFIKAQGRLFRREQIIHSYPMCYRSDTPLIYRAVPSWFIRVEDVRDQLCNALDETHWVPQHVRDGRFHNWLANARDWAVSRNRFWGTPLPIWANEADPRDYIVVGSVAELAELSGRPADSITDLHRDSVDDIVIQRGGATYRRVPEVFDCWFESGSMPYARLHYPFDSAVREAFERGDVFPADFIAEGIDQCRGWFYVLLVIGVLLYGRAPFRNVIVFGLILANDGEKMSKRKHNYTDPLEIVQRYSADALRLYLISSPAVKAENLLFADEGVYEVRRSVLIPWYSAYNFLTIQITRYEQGGERFVPTRPDSTAEIDRWLLTEFSRLVTSIRTLLDDYELSRVMSVVLAFIDRLTNTYVRFCRSRLKGEQGRDECLRALNTLYYVLTQLCVVTCPFVPFISEVMYRNLRRIAPAGYVHGYCEDGEPTPRSVHFTLYPDVSGLEDAAAHRLVTHALEAIDLGRLGRDLARAGLQQPLPRAVFAHHNAEVVDDINAFSRFICSELKVKEVVATLDVSRVARLVVQPNRRVLCRRLGKAANAVIAQMDKLTYEQASQLRDTGRLTVAGAELTADDVILQLEALPREQLPEGEVVIVGGTNNALVMALDTKLSPELQREGVSVRLFAQLQKMRKQIGLQLADACDVVVVPLSDDAKSVYEAAAAELSAVTKGGAFSVLATAPADGEWTQKELKDEANVFMRATH